LHPSFGPSQRLQLIKYFYELQSRIWEIAMGDWGLFRINLLCSIYYRNLLNRGATVLVYWKLRGEIVVDDY
ncbi:MAG: hypothetical protein V3575_04935, partial [Candidatus Absconditabacteria bacterium]